MALQTCGNKGNRNWHELKSEFNCDIRFECYAVNYLYWHDSLGCKCFHESIMIHWPTLLCRNSPNLKKLSSDPFMMPIYPCAMSHANFPHERAWLDFEIWELGLVNFVFVKWLHSLGTIHIQIITKPITSPSELGRGRRTSTVFRAE